jgi:Rad3-related DNA helicase
MYTGAMTESNIMDYWPFPYPPRQNQEIALPWLAANQDKRYLILEAPVGAGKSNIGLVYSLFRGSNAFVLTPQRILQEQYEESFQTTPEIDLASFYGKSNYQCHTKNADCSVGSLVKPRCKDCPYDNARDNAKSSHNTVMNYALGLGVWAFTRLFKSKDGEPVSRNLMILDECHTLEESLVGFDALAITEWRCKKYNVKWQRCDTLKKACNYLRDVYFPKMKEVVNDLASDLEYLKDKTPSDLTKGELNKLKELAALETHVFEEVIVFSSAQDAEIEKLSQAFVLVNDPKMFEFKRLSGARAFRNIVEPMADQFLFMSSTVLDKDGFCRDLGIDPNDAAFLSLQSEFDVSNRPVYYMPQHKMNYKWTEDAAGKKRMLETIEKLLEMHDGESGIIHTGNFKIAEWLCDNLDIEQQIFSHNPGSGDDRNAIIKAFIASPKPGVLISPSSTEGLDLKGDLGKFAIFAKVPFGSLGDQWIKRRMEMSKTWYQRRALIDIIQGGGRIVRGPEDTGSVYILDQSFGFLKSQTNTMIPRWWHDSYQTL